MSTTLAQAQQMVQFYVEAEQLVLRGKSMTKGGRTWTREDLGEIRKGRQEWERKVRSLSFSGAQRGPVLAEF